MTVFVPLEDPVKVIRLRLHNKTNDRRSLSVTYYAEWVLGVHREGNASFIVTDWDEESSMLIARNTYQENFREATGFLGVYMPEAELAEAQGSKGVLNNRTSSGEQTWTSDRLEFLGRNGSYENPAAMKRVSLSGTTGSTYDACGAIQSKFVLEPGEEQTIYILLGCEESNQSAVQLADKYGDPNVCERAFDDVKKFWDGVLGTITVRRHPRRWTSC